ncbi:unnamed protein product [Parajaminaea phylloscopi]
MTKGKRKEGKRKANNAAAARKYRQKFAEAKQPVILPAEASGSGWTTHDHHQKNLIITGDNGVTILQRISATSAEKHSALLASMAEGQRLQEALDDKLFTSRHGNTSTHLGIWYNFRDLGFTRPHELGRPATDDFVGWLQGFSRSFVQSLADLLAPDIKEALDTRTGGLEWCKKWMGEKRLESFHPWWTTAAIIRGFTTSFHEDSADAQPSILVSFKVPVVLELRGPRLRVVLHPGDVLFFNSKEEDHRVQPLEPDSPHNDERWAVSLFVRKKQDEQDGDGRGEDPKLIRMTTTAGPSVEAGRRQGRAAVP